MSSFDGYPHQMVCILQRVSCAFVLCRLASRFFAGNGKSHKRPTFLLHWVKNHDTRSLEEQRRSTKGFGVFIWGCNVQVPCTCALLSIGVLAQLRFPLSSTPQRFALGEERGQLDFEGMVSQNTYFGKIPQTFWVDSPFSSSNSSYACSGGGGQLFRRPHIPILR